MEHSTENDVSEEHQEQEDTLGRRQLLKTLIATGGAVAASALLSSKWVKPIIEAGVLPAHAQGSITPTPSPTPSSSPTVLCYTPTPSSTPTFRPVCYTATPPATAPPSLPTLESRRSLLEQLLAEERFPPGIARELDEGV